MVTTQHPYTSFESLLCKIFDDHVDELYNKRIESCIGVVLGRLISETHQQDHKNFSKKLTICLGAGGEHIKHKFLKHYQVFLIAVS